MTQGAFCSVLRVSAPGQGAIAVAGSVPNGSGQAALIHALCALRMTEDNSVLGRALFAGQQVASRDLSTSDAGVADAKIFLAHGLVGLIATPLGILDDRYVIVVGFTEPPADLAPIASMLLYAASSLRPLLCRFNLQDTDILLRSAFAACKTSVMITDADFTRGGPHILFANPAFEQMTGYDLAEIKGQSPALLQGPLSDIKTRLGIRTLLGRGMPVITEIENKRKDGGRYWVALNISPIRDHAGIVTHFVSISADITEKRAARAERALMATDIASLVAAMPGVLIRHERTTANVWARSFVADSIEALTGYTAAEAKDIRWFRENTDPAGRLKLNALMLQAEAGKESSLEFRFRRKDETWTWLQMTNRGHVNALGVLEMTSILTDFTVERQMNIQLAQSNKLAQLGELATGMAHELNQRLMGISMAAENGLRALARVSEPTGRVEQKLQTIIDLTHRASLLIDQVLSFGRMEAMKIETVSLSEAIMGVKVLMVGILRDSRVQLAINIPGDLPPVSGQVARLQQVFINLIVNACHAYESQGLAVFPGSRKIALTAQVNNDLIEIRVSDHAGGIPAAILPRVFEPFFTTKAAGVGTGLGLSIIGDIISEMKGKVSVDSLDGGTMFTITLPRSLEA